MLHVMPDLVGDDVRLREVARRAETAPQLVIEAEVDVDLLVQRTVKRPHRRLADAARRRRRAAKHHDGRLAIPVPEQLPPRVLGVVDNEVDELKEALLLRRLVGRWPARL
jgi:hypothetical protein